jgi:hypothetical protein
MIDRDIKEKMRKLQPKAKVCDHNRRHRNSRHADNTQFIFLVRSIDLAKAMRDFDITVSLSSGVLADDPARVDRGQADQIRFALQRAHGRGEQRHGQDPDEATDSKDQKGDQQRACKGEIAVDSVR